MNTEIELKYLVSGQDAKTRISDYLDQNNIAYQQQVKYLGNNYFDTADQALRKLDMGLRIRTCNDQYEQTIKTAGEVIGGLHQRPEYNVQVTQPYPELSLFPEDIWRGATDVNDLQQQLISLFNTHFERVTWLISDINGNVIELAYDQGNISTQGREEPICEIELELVKGHRDALFSLAQGLFSQLALRPGIKSKAARGYALWLENHKAPAITPFELVPLSNTKSINHAFTQGLSFGLSQLQLMVDAYVEKPSFNYLVKVVEDLALLRHGFWMFEQYLPEQAKPIRDELSHFMQLLQWVDGATFIRELVNKTGNYRKRMEYSKQLIEQLKLEKRRSPDSEHVVSLFCSERFNQLQLDLLKLLLSMKSDKSETAEDLPSFAIKHLDTNLANTFTSHQNQESLTIAEYLAQQKYVIRSLLTGSWFGGLFPKSARLAFRGPWLDIKHGLSELQTLSVLQKQLQTLDEPPKKLVNWHQDKVASLLLALDSSRHSAIAMSPYWRSI